MRYKDFLRESLSVSDKLIPLTNEIYNIICKKLNNSKEYISKTDNKSFKCGCFDLPCSKYFKNIKELHIDYISYCVDRNEDAKYFNTRCECDYERKTIHLRLVSVNDMPYPKFREGIAHELNHMLQNDNGAQKNETLYDKCINTYKCSEKQSLKWLAYALYLSFQTERNAFIQQYYEHLKTNDVDILTLEKTFPFDKGNPYAELEDAIAHIENYSYNENEVYSAFGITLNKVYNYIDNALDSLYNKVMKVYAKYYYEYDSISKRVSESTDIQVRMNFILECEKRGVREYEDDYKYVTL